MFEPIARRTEAIKGMIEIDQFKIQEQIVSGWKSQRMAFKPMTNVSSINLHRSNLSNVRLAWLYNRMLWLCTVLYTRQQIKMKTTKTDAQGEQSNSILSFKVFDGFEFGLYQNINQLAINGSQGNHRR